MGERRIKHYSNKHRILLVGEGDFSFSLCLANIVATSLDSKDSIGRNYSFYGERNLMSLKMYGCTIMHEVDAHTMTQHPLLANQHFDRIIFNFPHAGFIRKETSLLQIELHKEVVRGLMKSAGEMVSEDGEIHVTHKTTFPFTCWGIVDMAEEEGLCLVDEVAFWKEEYPEYNNVKGNGVSSVAIEGGDKDEVVVIGDEVDSVCLANSLRKKFKKRVTLEGDLGRMDSNWMMIPRLHTRKGDQCPINPYSSFGRRHSQVEEMTGNGDGEGHRA
ncbi:putative S-adenosyl-L-methionine-dependent methyltransferase [Senna tora]|uniref:Putative S-adenosyl-L-methionine-dependent methyltransferase n=1 Tax=Senna tora TaxID=362788 RepID=A0A834WAA9_9FABA|nr:putative S-adenosyl-L-methionine-dependent methyltransferase [Senna tora]